MDIKKLYNMKYMTADAIAKQIKSDSVISSDIGIALPPAITEAIARRARNGEINKVIQHTILDMDSASCFEPDLFGKYTGVSWFSGKKGRTAINNGYGDFMPATYRDFHRLFNEYIDVDYLTLTVSEMDEEGYFSLGSVASVVPDLLKKADKIFLEVNPFIPQIYGAPKIHLNQIDGFCINPRELPEGVIPEVDEVSRKIGEYIVERIPDGATIQLGIGSIPEAVGKALQRKKHLGIHTEMMNSSMVDLIESGVVDNTCKDIHKGKSVFTFASPSAKLYNFLSENKDIELLPAKYVNDPTVISRHKNFASINTAFEVDIMGQVCAESLGQKHFSGSGGQTDFVRGATMSEGGQSFIAFSSTTRDGKSKIRTTLTTGAIVTTTRTDVDMIVTEYGIAKLRGQTLRQRILNLISIAHPDFREELIFEAKKLNYII